MNASILKYLRANGEQLDADISLALDIPMNQLKTQVAELSASGDVICCKVTRFIDGKKIEGTSCRLSCDLPAPARLLDTCFDQAKGEALGLRHGDTWTLYRLDALRPSCRQAKGELTPYRYEPQQGYQ